MRFIWVILICLVCSGAFAQDYKVNIFKPEVQAWKDTLEKKKLQFIFSFDSRRSFFLGQGGKIAGLRIGMGINHMHRFGIGSYGLNRDIIIPDVPLTVPVDSGADYLDTLDVHFNFGYASLFYERVLLRNRKWELAVPFHFGGGRIRASFTDSAGVVHQPIDKRVSLWEVSVTGQYNILSWFAVGTGVGYRGMLVNEDLVRRSWRGPIYIVKAKVMIFELYRALFKKNKTTPDAVEPDIDGG